MSEYANAPDYTGVPLFQLRRFLAKHRRPMLWFFDHTDINFRELSRIFRHAQPNAVLGLGKVDIILSALGFTVTELDDELTIVPMGAGMQNAYRVARDEFETLGLRECESELEQRAREIRWDKRRLLASAPLVCTVDAPMEAE